MKMNHKHELTSLISMLDAPASREFSISSFTTELTEVMTWELAIIRTVDEGNKFIALELEHSISDEALTLIINLWRFQTWPICFKTLKLSKFSKKVCTVRPPYLILGGKCLRVMWQFFVTTSRRTRFIRTFPTISPTESNNRNNRQTNICNVIVGYLVYIILHNSP